MAVQRMIALSVGDQLDLPDENGVMTGYIIESIEGTLAESHVYLQHANISAVPKRVMRYLRID